MKTTPLYDMHKALGGKIVTFAGWELPVQYSGVIPEHTATRTKAGLFDVSHMGEIFVTGPEAEQAIQYLTSNNIATLTDGKAQYGAILNPKGGVVDDIIVYRYSKERYLICVNASNADKDFAWFTKHNKHNATFENKSASYGQIALQGPMAKKIVEAIPDMKVLGDLAYFHFKDISVAGVPVIAARTGYTGEDGFEFFIPWNDTVSIWKLLMEAGEQYGVTPCGLGARDSLRLEACYPLHGHELGDEISALESGLGWVIKFDKGEFIGKEALLKEKEQGAKRSLTAFYVTDPGIVRENEKVLDASGKEIGITTSGTKTPTVNRALGLALIDRNYSKAGSSFFVEVRGRKLACEATTKPFYKKEPI